MTKRIITIGPITKDYIITPHEEYSQIGGAVFYQTMTLKQFNANVLSIISIGIDDVEILGNYFENVSALLQEKTMLYTNIYDENLKRKQKAAIPLNPIKPEDINRNIEQAEYALLSPLSPFDIPVETVAHFKNNNIKTVLVAQGFLRKTDHSGNVIKNKWTNITEYLHHTDILFLDENEAKTAFQTDTLNDSLIKDILIQNNIEQIIITKAENGSTIYTKENIYHIPAIKTTKIIDATGLGDTYIASYIYKLQETQKIFTSGLFASITAKEKLKNKGPLIASKEKIEKELKVLLNKYG